jgi:integrase
MSGNPSGFPRHTPSLRHHKASGQGFVQLNGRTIYLGRYDLPQTRQKYHRLIAEWEASGRHLPVSAGDFTIVELVEQFWEFTKRHYRNSDGSLSQEQDNYRLALRPLLDAYASVPVADFGPRGLKAVRELMIQKSWARTHVNRQLARVKFLFKWGCEEELVPPSVFHSLQAVSGLRRGRCEARETAPVRPVPEHVVRMIQPFVSKQIWAMVNVQLLTGCRPDEVVRLRPIDLDMNAEVWVARLEKHKSAIHGMEKLIFLGPKAQEFIRPFLAGRSLDQYLFSPAEAEAARRETLHRGRITPPNAGNRPGTNRKPVPRRRPRHHFDVNTYRRAIERACDLAFPPPGHLTRQKLEGAKGARWETRREWRARLGPEHWKELQVWWDEHRWAPNQLRHSAATLLRNLYGLDVAQTVLGHRIGSKVTEIYGEANRLKAMEALKQVG